MPHTPVECPRGWALSTAGGLLPPLPPGWPKVLAGTWPWPVSKTFATQDTSPAKSPLLS